jgi:hypothetical protein
VKDEGDWSDKRRSFMDFSRQLKRFQKWGGSVQVLSNENVGGLDFALFVNEVLGPVKGWERGKNCQTICRFFDG